ncbi:MAG: sigma-70 family RNA polymerase sigma factor [Chitinophagaceae bacterium]|nr:sigma-70 family RNA polymerase sigma factor [Chitinophagaceae bacterium]
MTIGFSNRYSMDMPSPHFYYENRVFLVVLAEMASLTGNNDTWNLLRRGDRQALLALYREHYTGLVNFGIKLTGSRELSKDCFSQVLLRLWDRRASLPEVSNTRSYLLTCMKHEIMKELQSQKNNTGHQQLETGNHTEPSYEDYIVGIQANDELRCRLRKMLQKLTEREKELLKLRFFENRSYDEIAEQCDIAKRTAYNIIFGALKTLKKEMMGKETGSKAIVPLIIILFTCLWQ